MGGKGIAFLFLSIVILENIFLGLLFVADVNNFTDFDNIIQPLEIVSMDLVKMAEESPAILPSEPT